MAACFDGLLTAALHAGLQVFVVWQVLCIWCALAL